MRRDFRTPDGRMLWTARAGTVQASGFPTAETALRKCMIATLRDSRTTNELYVGIYNGVVQ